MSPTATSSADPLNTGPTQAGAPSRVRPLTLAANNGLAHHRACDRRATEIDDTMVLGSTAVSAGNSMLMPFVERGGSLPGEKQDAGQPAGDGAGDRERQQPHPDNVDTITVGRSQRPTAKRLGRNGV